MSESSSLSSFLSPGTSLFLITILSTQLYSYIKSSKKYEKAFWSERKGRSRVEFELKAAANLRQSTIVASDSINSTGYYIESIGKIYSCYRQCLGTPRQGLLAPASHSILKFSPQISPECLDGLEEFSHVWLTFHFHLNSNTLKENKIINQDINRQYKKHKKLQGNNEKLNENEENEDNNESDDINEQINDDNEHSNDKYDETSDKKKKKAKKNILAFNAKINLPMLKDKKGVLATRSPHRPNSVGITLAGIRSIDKKNRIIYLYGCDLVEDTPIIDVKPYVPVYDTVPEGTCKIATWIENTVYTRNTVHINDSIKEKVHSIAGKLRDYKDKPDDYLKGLIETLEVDVRSKFQTKQRISQSNQGIEIQVPFDETTVSFLWLSEREFQITNIDLSTKEEKERLERNRAVCL